MDISKLSNSELTRLVGRMLVGRSISYSDYNLDKIVDTYNENPYVYSIINRIASAAKSVNLMAGKTVDDEFQENQKGELFKVISKPSPIMTVSELKEYCAIYYLLFGECFIYFQRYGAGNSVGRIIPGTIQLAPPNVVEIQHENYIVNGYLIKGDMRKVIDIENMIHIKAFNPDYTQLHGTSPVAVAGRLLDKINAADDTETMAYQNGGPATLVTLKEANQTQPVEFQNFISRLKNIWKSKNDKRGIAGSDVPLEVHKFGATSTDMGTIESQQNTLKILLVLWNLNPGLFDTAASTYENVQTMERQIYTQAAIPFIEKLVDKLNNIFEPIYGEKIVTDTSGIEALQPNFKDKIEWMKLAGVFSDNQILEAVGYDKRESDVSELSPLEQREMGLIGFSNLDREVYEA
jgi:phage portal protein BeeE